MSTNKATFTLGADAELGSALAAFYDLFEDWNGKPTKQHLAAALSVVWVDYMSLVEAQRSHKNVLADLVEPKLQVSPRSWPSRRHLDNANLLLALVAALREGTADGWRIPKLSGSRGLPTTSADFDEKFKITEYILARMADAIPYEFAVEYAAKEFGCGTTRAKEAYSMLKPIVQMLRHIGERSPEAASETRSRVRANPRTGRVR